MLAGYDKHNEITATAMCNLFKKTQDINKVMEAYPGIDYNVILSIIYSKQLHFRLEPCQLKINDKKILFISDTHYGSIYDNMDYANYVFDYAKGNGINTILHGGDVLDGGVNSKDGFVPKKEAEYFIENYPFDKDIITHAILGNHDYMAAYSSHKVRKILNSRDDIDIMGFKKIYFSWNDSNFGLQHEVKKYRLCFPTFDEEICFKGHSHYYHTKYFDGKDEVYIPSLSDIPTPCLIDPSTHIENKNTLKPGFIVAEKFDDCIIINHYFFENKEIIKENEFVKKLTYTSN